MTIAIIGATIIGEWAEAAVVVILFAISEARNVFHGACPRIGRSLMKLAPEKHLSSVTALNRYRSRHRSRGRHARQTR